MENLITVLFDILLCTGYITIGIIGAFVIQLISYRVFKFNLYKFLKYILIEREVR